MEKAIIIGAGTYGQVYQMYLSEKYNIIGFIDDNKDLIGQRINGIEVLGNNEYLSTQVDKNISVFAPIGNNEIRVSILKKLKQEGFKTPNFIHPKTVIDNSVQIGEAVYILPATNIMPLTIIKNYVMISMGVNIAHHNIIEDGCFFSQGTNIGASVTIKSLAFLSISSTVMTGVKIIGENSLIGAGTVVIKDVPQNAIVAGVPAKILRYKI